MRSPRLAALELRRFGRGKLPRAAVVAIVLLPLLYSALYLWSFWDPYGRLDRIPVALVNDDKGTKADGEKVAAGDEIAKGLRDSEVFDWHEVSEAEARKGVEDGAYYLSLTMPKDFSERVASSSGDSPQTGALQVRTNDANNYIVGQVSRTVFAEVRTAASTKASRSFLDRIFISFSDIHDATADAAKGADDLKGGIGKAKDASGELANGLKSAKDNTGKLAGGLATLTQGASDLESLSHQIASGTQALSDKVNAYASDVRPFLEKNGTSIADTARLAADSAQVIRDDLGALADTAPTAATEAQKSADALTALHQEQCVDAAEPDAAACPALERAATTAADAAETAAGVSASVQGNKDGLTELDGRLADFQQKATDLAERAPGLDKDLTTAIDKINTLNTGAGALSQGAAELHTGLTGARTGSSEIDSGVGKLREGAGDLDGGMFKLVDGSAELAGGLHDGVAKIPDYDEKDRDRRTEVMADPVKLASQTLNKAPNYGTGFAPYFIPLSLWVGAMVAYMIIQPMNRRALAAGGSAWRIALAGWLPVVAIGLVQVGVLMAVLHWSLGLKTAHAAGTVAFLALVVCCFASIIQWLNARFGAAGRILVLAVLMLQLTSAGGTYPVQTSPAFFNAIHPFLPMSYVVEALRRLITGGGLEPVWQASAVLLAFTAGALALTALTARRKQVWTLDRLHPELSL
ncbi:YhgE/Pip family protein [Streptomyces katsurahamanus]|uniref:YhgE/Pip domain-containing protein n=1 Tax=Streptomyces katsurahamanus TaxID=2577098 RepID=A0ABW9NPG8_9ACTN|nr:YhgE/Pip domain-containing protein [Streptomyces katsurahamanus]MQS35195.1 YhgE/Pip domain-containing protein [Streptomyces katsurahamanus]